MPNPVVEKTIYFDPSGGPLSVRMLAAFASPGHYSLMLLEHDRIKIVKDWGNVAFASPEANTHKLPGAAGEHDGRFLHMLSSIGIVEPSGKFSVVMTVVQDGKDIGEVRDEGTSTENTKESEFAALLLPKPEVVKQ